MYKVYGNTVIAVFLMLASSVPLMFNTFKRVIQEVKYFPRILVFVRSSLDVQLKDTSICMSHNSVLVTVRNVIFVSACIFSIELLVR